METIRVSELKSRTIPFHHDGSRLSWSVKIKYQSSGKPGCYPDRSTPRVCRVLFQPRICLRTITCLELAVKNMVGSGSQKHKQAQQSWPFLPTSSFAVIWRVMTTRHKTPHFYPGTWSVTEVIQRSLLSQCPGSKSFSFQKAPTAIRKNSMIRPPCPPLPVILRKKKNTSPLPVHLQGQRKLSSMLTHTDTLTHRLQTFTHNTHMLPMGTREGLTGARSADVAVSQMGHFVAYRWGIQRQQDYYVEWMHGHPYIQHTHKHTHTWSQILVDNPH